MNRMPYEIKQKIRQLNKAVLKAKYLSLEVETMIESFGVPVENLIAVVDIYSDEPSTEALAYINNGECATARSLEESIAEIEKIFLHFVEKSEH